MSSPEVAVERELTDRVWLAGGMTVKLAPTAAGVPDRLVLLPGGRLHLVELKAPGGRLSKLQRLWHSRAAALGTEVLVLRSVAQVRAWEVPAL